MPDTNSKNDIKSNKKPSIKKIIIIFAIIFVVLTGFVLFRALTSYGELTRLMPVFDGKCTLHTNIRGAEDIAYDPINKQVIAISHNNIAFNYNSAARGHIYSLPIDDILSQTPKTIDTGEIGQPLGISLKGKTLGVVNYNPHPQIELYDIMGLGQLKHKQTIAIFNLKRINDIAILDDTHFYITNDSDKVRDSLDDFLSKLFLSNKSGSIWLYNNGKLEKVETGLKYANSIAISSDNKTLYATDTIGRSLRIYEILPDYKLKQIDEVFLGTGPDNISIDNDGRLFIATHPKMVTLYANLKGFGTSPPSQVIMIEPNKDKNGGKVDQIYLNNDKQGYAAASSAIKIDDKLIMGSLYETGLNVCTLPAEWRQSISHPARSLIDTERGNEQKLEKLKEKVEHNKHQ